MEYNIVLILRVVVRKADYKLGEGGGISIRPWMKAWVYRQYNNSDNNNNSKPFIVTMCQTLGLRSGQDRHK